MYSLNEQLKQDTELLGQFPLSDVLLMKDAHYPWVILVPRRADVREIFHLSQKDRHQLSDESSYVSQRLSDFFEADSMNMGALGNIVSQLHVHHVVRTKEDISWPKPVWGAQPAKAYTEAELEQRIDQLTRLFSDKFVEDAPQQEDDTVYW